MRCSQCSIQTMAWYILKRIVFVIFICSANISVVSAQMIDSTGTSVSDKLRIKKLIGQIKQNEAAVKFSKMAVNTVSDSSQIPYLLFQLSELLYRNEKLRYSFNLEKYDLQLQLFEAKKIKSDPEEPLLTYSKTLKINQQIIEEYPDFEFMPQILYRSSICFYETGRTEQARELFYQLLPNCKNDTLKAELTFRIGESLFDDGNYVQALSTYKKILDDWDNPFFSMALYKIGWCHYRMENISEAISTFYYLLSDIRLIEKIDSEILGKSKIDLTEEVKEYIALSFSDYGGVSALLGFIHKMGETDHKPDLLFKLGQIYLKRNFYEDCSDTFEHLIQQCPGYAELPSVFLKLYDCYENLGINKAKSIHQKFTKTCGPGSPWRLANAGVKNKELYEDALEKMTIKMATPFIISADSLFAANQFNFAIKKYNQFLTEFPTDKRADHAQFFIGECLFNLEKYEEAGKAYYSILQNYPGSELFEDAAYNRIICYDKIQQDSSAIAATDLLADTNQGTNDLIRVSKDYLKLFPNSDRSPEVKLKIAELFYGQGKFVSSEKYAHSALKSILKYQKGKQHKIPALNLLAQIYFKQEEYIKAKKLYSVLLSQRSDSLALKDKWKKMFASSMFKIGEQLKSNGQSKKAAFNFEMTAIRSTDPEIAETSLFEAAIQYEKAGMNKKAALKFESLFQKYPQSERSKEYVYRAGVLREKLEQFHLAAKNYENLYKLTGDTEEGCSALFNAGLAYEKANDWFSVFRIFSRYVNLIPDSSDRKLEAMFKIAYADEQNNQTSRAKTNYNRVIQKYFQISQSGKFADEYFAAHAAFRLAEMKNKSFENVQLKPPFQLNLKRKQQIFNDMLKMYVDATKYNIAEWTTASFYKIGLAYEQFCQDIMNSPSPANLNEDQLNSYWNTIHQKWVVPLQVEALKYYETNKNMALQNSIQNQWTEKTENRIMLLRSNLSQNSTAPPINQFKQASGTTAGKSNGKRRAL